MYGCTFICLINILDLKALKNLIVVLLSRTEFCLGLDFVWDFVSDYIPQLYFVCNHLIYLHILYCVIMVIVVIIKYNKITQKILAPKFKKNIKMTNFQQLFIYCYFIRHLVKMKR